MKLNTQLKKLMAKQNLNVARLSRATGVSDKMIYSWLEKNQPKDFVAVKKVADYFKVSLDYLLFDETKFDRKISIVDIKEEISLGLLEVVVKRPRTNKQED